MTFMQIGRKLQERFKKELSEDRIYNALQWSTELQAIPVGIREIPDTAYIESMSMRGYEPNPTSTNQLNLAYTITQHLLSISQEEAAERGRRALFEREPKQFSEEWEETLRLSIHGCFNAWTGLVYTRRSDSVGNIPYAEERRYTSSNHSSLVKGEMYFEVKVSDKQFKVEAEKIVSVLSNPEEVLEIFVQRWINGNKSF